MKIFVSRDIPGKSLDKLKSSEHEVVISEFDRPLTAEELLEKAKGADAILTLLTDKIDADVIDAIGPQLKIISNYAVGFDNINLEDATTKQVVVTNTPSNEVSEAVAEHSWGLLTSLARRIDAANDATKKGAYKGWDPGLFLGRVIYGKTLGIVGLGRIGSMTARIAKGYNMKVFYTKRKRDEKAEQKLGVEFAELDDLLSKSDFVSLHVPLTEETRHMINEDTLSKFKKGAYLVNTARGPVINERDLVEALRNGQLAGVGMDVFDNEPNVNLELMEMENVVMTPHIASATVEARDKMGEQAVSAILDTFSGKKPENLVNEKVWEKRRK